MAIRLPAAPDRPRVSVPRRKKLKPLRLKTTTGNVYRSTPPKIVKRKPLPKPKVVSPVPPAPVVAPTPAGDPYDQYASYRQIKGDENAHTGYVTGQVAPWLSAALTALTGTDPNNPSLNSAMQGQYLGTVQGAVGGALGAAGAATPMNPAATTPGGIVASPSAYLSDAAREGAAGRATGYLDSARAQSALNTMQPNTQAQGYVYALADYAKGLPAVYAQKRAEARAKIDEIIADQNQQRIENELQGARIDEQIRHNRVSEATSATNAQTNAAIQLSRLGLSAADQAFDNQTPTGAVPEGIVQLPDGSYRNDPTYVAPGSGPAATGNKPMSPTSISAMNGKWKRPKSSPPKLGPGWKQPVWDPGTKAWYAKKAPGAGGTTTKPYVPRTSTTLQSSLAGYWKAGGSGGIEERYTDNPEGAGKWLAQWVRDNKKDFLVKGKGRKADLVKLRQVLGSIGGRPAAEALSILTRGYISPAGEWK